MFTKVSSTEYQKKIIQIKRVTKVVKGGKIMTFRVIVIIGDNINNVGIGIGRADDIVFAIEKAILNGTKNLITIPITSKLSIPYVIKQSYGACDILLRPAREGTGIKAGGAVRTILELGGIQNIITKQYGSNNILNNAKATIIALNLLTKK